MLPEGSQAGALDLGSRPGVPRAMGCPGPRGSLSCGVWYIGVPPRVHPCLPCAISMSLGYGPVCLSELDEGLDLALGVCP